MPYGTVAPVACYVEGWRRVWAHRKLLFLFYLPNLILAYLATLPLRKALTRSIGHSLMSDRLAAGLSLGFLGDLGYENPGLYSTLLSLTVAAGLIYLVTVTFLLGGAVRALSLPRRRALSEIFSDSAAYFGCYLRLLLLSIPFYAAALVLGWFVAKGILAASRSVGGPGPWLAARILTTLVLFFLLFFVNLLFDYAKILAVRDGAGRAFAALRGAFRFVFRHAGVGKGLALYYLVVVTGLLVLVLYNVGASLLDSPTPFAIALLALWQQLFILARLWVKLLFYSAQSAAVESLSPGIEPVEPVEFLA